MTDGSCKYYIMTFHNAVKTIIEEFLRFYSTKYIYQNVNNIKGIKFNTGVSNRAYKYT